MIKIEAKKKIIPIEIGSNTFEFDLSDDSILKLQESYQKVIAEIEKSKIDENISEKERVEQVKIVQQKSIDFLLGEGAFNKIYSEVESISSITEILLELNIQLPKEIEEIMAAEKMKKYLGE
ncbi:hypothetical protein [Enterococcus sp. AZ163]|uniref:hypothetical protein n=1 Tax=Enterococcus sp. AZ163 TaxID=2774638 RepID=UPI003D298B69